MSIIDIDMPMLINSENWETIWKAVLEYQIVYSWNIIYNVIYSKELSYIDE